MVTHEVWDVTLLLTVHHTLVISLFVRRDKKKSGSSGVVTIPKQVNRHVIMLP